jgi:hypothetical protein
MNAVKKPRTKPFLGERGDGRVGLILTIIVVSASVFAAVKIIPAKMRAYEFGDYIREEAQKAAWSKDEALLRKHILEKARSLELPVNDKNLKVEFAPGEIRVSADYQLTVDLKVTKYTMTFQPQERAPLF